jgi:tight adherence protein C
MKTFKAWLRRRQRWPEIAAALPGALDLLVLVMKAGLDFQVAIDYYVQRAPRGVLHEELSVFQTELRTGISRVEALHHLSQRVPHPDLQETVRALIQGIELGSSLTPLLRQQAQALRKRRGYEAEKCAALAPLKLMAPLFLFIFPTLFVVLFGPLVLSFMQGGTP